MSDDGVELCVMVSPKMVHYDEELCKDGSSRCRMFYRQVQNGHTMVQECVGFFKRGCRGGPMLEMQRTHIGLKQKGE